MREGICTCILPSNNDYVERWLSIIQGQRHSITKTEIKDSMLLCFLIYKLASLPCFGSSLPNKADVYLRLLLSCIGHEGR